MATKILVDTDSIQTLTNKTLTAPAITSGVLTTSTVAANPTADLGVASKQYVDDLGESNRLTNPVINGQMNIWQRGVSFTSATTPANSDDTYLADRWILLSDGNDIVDVVREGTTIPTSGLYAISLDIETVNKKFGILQVVEQRHCTGFLGSTCTLSFKAKVSATTKLDNVKAALITWDGTADTVTSDIISAWGVEGTNPTLVANWTYENTPTNLSVTTSYATYSVSAALDTASGKNIGLFIWSDVTDTTLGDFLFITDVQLQTGSTVLQYPYRSFADELVLCQRYYAKTYPQSVVPGTANTVGALAAVCNGTAAAAGLIQWCLPATMRATPTLTIYSVNDGASGNFYRTVGAANVAGVAYQTGETAIGMYNNAVVSDLEFIAGHATAVAEL